jgi:hypothetical protein
MEDTNIDLEERISLGQIDTKEEDYEEEGKA